MDKRIRSEIGKIIVFVNVSYYIPTEDLEKVDSAQENSPTFVDLLFTDINKFFTEGLKKLGLFVENGIAKVKEIFADKITTKQLCVEDICVDREQLKALLERSQIQNQAFPVGSGQVTPQESEVSISEPPAEPLDNTQDEQPSAEESPTEEQPVAEPTPAEASAGEQLPAPEPPAEPFDSAQGEQPTEEIPSADGVTAAAQ